VIVAAVIVVVVVVLYKGPYECLRTDAQENTITIHLGRTIMVEETGGHAAGMGRHKN